MTTHGMTEMQKTSNLKAGKVYHGSNNTTDLVEWEVQDPERPMNFTFWKKCIITMSSASITFTVSFGSSIFSATIPSTTHEFHISEVVVLLGVSLYVLGFAVGPLLWGPLSEYQGRKVPLFIGFFLFAIFQIPVATAKDIETILLFRFLAGASGSALLAINPAMFADYWNPVDRGVAVSIFSVAAFAGPTLGPVVGSYLTESHLGWTWTAWLILIMSVAFGAPAFCMIPETYEPVLLKRRASKMRAETGNAAIHAKDEHSSFSLKKFSDIYLKRPFRLLADPILLILTVYISFVYGITYLFFFAIPYAYESQRHFSSTTATLPFLGLLIGIVIAAVLLSLYMKTYYQRRLRSRGSVCPEDRLPPMIVGSFSLPFGLFMFAWTSSPQRVASWMPQVISGIPIGFGTPLIFMSGISYIVDIYKAQASSAMALNTFIRSFTAAAFPLFAPAIAHRLGIEWMMSLLGFLCIALIPAPITFCFHGEQIRNRSQSAASTS